MSGNKMIKGTILSMARKKSVLIIAAVMCIVLCACVCVACGSNAAVTVTVPYVDESGVEYTLFKVTKGGKTEEYVKVTGYSGKTVSAPPDNVVSVYVKDEITIEDKVYPVTIVGNMAFYRAAVTNVYLGKNIVEIEPFAFAYGEFTSVELPASVKKIGEYAFVNCNSLRYLKLDAVVPPELGDYAFMFYNSKSNSYEVNGILTVKVPSDAKDTYLSEWKNYAAIIK